MDEEWREIKATWLGESAFLGENRSGKTVQMGALPDQPGTSPMEMVLLALAGCSGVDIVSILRKKRQQVSAFQIEVRGKRAETHPRVYTEIEVTYLVWGDNIDPQAVQQAINLSEEKYCSVSAMLKKATRIHSRYQILSPAENPAPVREKEGPG